MTHPSSNPSPPQLQGHLPLLLLSCPLSGPPLGSFYHPKFSISKQSENTTLSVFSQLLKFLNPLLRLCLVFRIDCGPWLLDSWRWPRNSHSLLLSLQAYRARIPLLCQLPQVPNDLEEPWPGPLSRGTTTSVTRPALHCQLHLPPSLAIQPVPLPFLLAGIPPSVHLCCSCLPVKPHRHLLILTIDTISPPALKPS